MVKVYNEEQRLKFFFLHPVVLAALFCVFFIYSNPNCPANKVSLFTGLDSSGIVAVSGKIEGNPLKQNNSYRIALKAFSCTNKKGITASCSGTIDAYIPSEYVERWYPGKLYTDNSIRAVNDACMPVEEGTVIALFGKFSSKKIFYADSAATRPFSSTILGRIAYFRALCRIRFKRLMFAWGEAGGLLLALLSGSREYTDQKLSEAFKMAGLSHIMALSGMHLSLFSSIALFLGKKLKNKKIAFLLQCLFIGFFVWFAGLSPSLLRALLCSSLMLLSSCFSITMPRPLHILSFAFLIHAFFVPGHLFLQSFILSYSALAGILIAGEFVQPFFSRNLPGFASSNVASSVGAQLFTSPYSIQVFKTFVPVCTAATLIVSPAVTIFMYAGFLCIILSFILPFLSPAFSGIMQLLYLLIKIPVLFFSKVPSVTM